MLIGVSGLAGSGKDTVADMLVTKYGFVKMSFADPLKRFAMEVYDFTEEQLWGPSEMRNAPDKRYLRGWRLGCGCVCEQWEWLDEGHQSFVAQRFLECCKDHQDRFKANPSVVWIDDTGEPKRDYLTPRLCLQILGTEFGRFCYPDTWVEYTIRAYERLQKGGVYYDRVLGLRLCSGFGEMMWPKVNVVIPDLRFINEFEGIEKAGGKSIRVVRPGAGLTGARASHASETQSRAIPDSKFKAVLQNTGTLEDLAASVDGVMASFPAV